MGVYEEIIELGEREESPVRYAWASGARALRMADHANPVSITEREFQFIREYIARRKLLRGYEIATGFGVSAIAAGLGMREHGGRLVTMDSYQEERVNAWNGYDIYRREAYGDAEGLWSVQYLVEALGLQDTVFARVGWSPVDTGVALDDVFGDEKLDYVFIDGAHRENAFLRDLDSVRGRLGRGAALFFHDWHTFEKSVPVKEALLRDYGKLPIMAEGCALPEGFSLVYLEC